MKNLTITQHGTTFIAGSSESIDEMHNLTGSVFDLWSAASSLLVSEDTNDVTFSFNEFNYSCDQFDAEWNEDLVGYVLTFADGKVAQTQTNIVNDKLNGSYGEEYLERYTEYDDELSEEQDLLIEDFVTQINLINKTYAK